MFEMKSIICPALIDVVENSILRRVRNLYKFTLESLELLAMAGAILQRVDN